MSNGLNDATDWFVNKVLPTIVLITVMGLFTLYVTTTADRAKSEEYRDATQQFRTQNKEQNKEQVKWIVENRHNFIRLDEKVIRINSHYLTKEEFYKANKTHPKGIKCK